ncbi:hypothetical protein RB653_009655 [Dictyostelium firmibasis]|uniref:Uncharacterized protein n=1 Tax=Dictyostelium firmibasis TaxID=79012 RepID=A0AAN7YVK4_9MYCE
MKKQVSWMIMMKKQEYQMVDQEVVAVAVVVGVVMILMKKQDYWMVVDEEVVVEVYRYYLNQIDFRIQYLTIQKRINGWCIIII